LAKKYHVGVLAVVQAGFVTSALHIIVGMVGWNRTEEGIGRDLDSVQITKLFADNHALFEFNRSDEHV
jgi:hypothetical protein